jgi:hypothetical protein
MGRPIKEKFFGNTNSPYSNTAQGGNTGVGGEGVATVATNNTGTLYSTSTTLSATFSAPQIPGGVAGTAQVTTNALGNIATVTLVTAGTGYTSAPTLAVTGGTTGTLATFTVALTSSRQNAIKGQAIIPGGSTQALYDIKKQEASRRYLVKTSEGSGQCKLVTTSTLAAGQLNIEATDANGSKYYVRKLTARRAVLVQTTASGSFAFADGAAAGWTLGSPSAGVVSIGNN